MAISKYQVSTMKETEVILFSMIEGELQEYQINAIQMYNLPQFFLS